MFAHRYVIAAFMLAAPTLALNPAAGHAATPAPHDLVKEVVALPRDQGRAFFEARGFPPAIGAQIADACVLRVVLKNDTGGQTLHVDLHDWRVRREQQQRRLRLEADWQAAWTHVPVPRAAAVAFHYALLPTVQVLAPGDWLQGMVTADLPPGRQFDLYIVWTEGDREHESYVRGLRCAS